MRHFLLPGCVLIALAACGGDDDGGGGDDPGAKVTSSEAAEACGDLATHADECGWQGDVNQADWNCGEAALLWRGDVFRAFATCAIELACDGDGMTCYEVALDAEPLAIHEEYAATCEAQKASCELTADSDTSSFLLACSADGLAAYSTELMESILGCFDQACADIVPCLDDLL